MPRTDSIIDDDARLRKSDRVERASADLARTDNDGTAYAASERRRMLRAEYTQEVLPKSPELPGWHTCWLTTNSQYDSIQKRMRLGYVPVKAEEIPGFEHLHMKSGEYPGCIACNEMILFKIPTDVYQEIMAEFHHHMPLESEQGLKQDALSQGAAIESEKGAEDGFAHLAKSGRVPFFA